MKLSVIIVNYNVKYFLEQCLCSIEQAAGDIDHEVIVVDNASTDGSTEYITERFPKVKWIASKENNGFSKGNNIAFAQAKGEYILMLNPDTIVTREALEGCISFMDQHTEAGACGVYMLRTDGTFAPESRRALPTPFVAFCKMSGLSKLFPKSRTLGRYYMQHLDKNKENHIDIMSGAYMFLRHSTIKETGTLDETFFMYGEDIDLCYRIKKAGWKIIYYGESKITHLKGASSKKQKSKLIYEFYRAMYIYYKKHHADESSFIVNIVVYLGIAVLCILKLFFNIFKKKD
jgi:GT2 family glycosyltransferase